MTLSFFICKMGTVSFIDEKIKQRNVCPLFLVLIIGL